LLGTICKSAFTGHAPIGGFAGSTVAMAINHGMSKAVYSGDIGIGYDAAIQVRTAIFSLLTDCAVCTFVVFSFTDQNAALTVMSVSGGGLLFINLLGIFKLRNEIKFSRRLVQNSQLFE
jgi:Na+/alanine symporter